MSNATAPQVMPKTSTKAIAIIGYGADGKLIRVLKSNDVLNFGSLSKFLFDPHVFIETADHKFIQVK